MGLALSEQARRVSGLEEGEEVGDGRAEGSSAIRDRASYNFTHT